MHSAVHDRVRYTALVEMHEAGLSKDCMKLTIRDLLSFNRKPGNVVRNQA